MRPAVTGPLFVQAYLDPIETLIMESSKPKIDGVVCAILAHKVAK